MRFIEQNSQHPVELVLRVLGIASSTYYEWKKRAVQPSDRHVEDEKLLAEIVDIRTSSGGTCGAPRVHAMLRRRGIRVGRKRVERLMRASQLQGAFLRKKWRLGSTRQDPRAPPAPDLVDRNFTAEEPNRLWVADATRIPYGQGAFWLAAVRDEFLRVEDLRPLRYRVGARGDGIRGLEPGDPGRATDSSQRPRFDLYGYPLR
nr:IS3 family transposase [Nocardia miyunensis]